MRIPSTDQDPGFSGNVYKNRATYGRRARRLAVVVVLLFVLASAPLPAHAGVVKDLLSFFSGVFSSSASTALPASVHNSQTVPLPRAALNVDPNPSQGGAEIIIVDGEALLSEAGPSGTQADIEGEKATSGQISIYVVREGDSLSQIAGMFNVSVNTIVWANDIRRGSLIRPGQTLVILPISGVRHEVEKGDTLKGVAKKYGGSLEEILQYNGLSEDAVLSVGDVVVVPDGEIATPVYAPSSVAVSGLSGQSYSGYYIRPVNGRRTQGIHGYNGVDLAAPYGTPIVAAASGQVIISRSYGWNGGYGVYIVIRHDNGTQTLYAHNNQNIVSQGQYVVQGQIVGYVGSTGRSTGPHVHFEVRGARNPF